MAVLRAGLIGAHISRTRLPAALEIMCAEAGWTLKFDLIDTADTADFEFEDRVTQARQDGWTGVTVTHPHKTAARRYAGQAMQGDVAHLGACNTLVFTNILTGFNTDYTGFLTVLERSGVDVTGDVLVMGAGGVAEAIVPALMARKHPSARIHVCDLDTSRATDLAQRTGAQAIPAQGLGDEMNAMHGLINCTPIGMAEHPGSAFDWLTLRNAPPKWAFDAVYTPTNTQFLRDARAAGLQVVTGFDLFRAMAVRSFQAYTGVDFGAEILPKLDTLKPD